MYKTTNEKIDDTRDILAVGIFCILLMIFISTFVIIKNINAITPVSTTIHNAYETTLEVKKENVEDVKENKYSITEEERELITRIIVTESRGEPLEGKIAVAQVILDRWLNRGGSITDILLSPNQFAKPYSKSIEEYPDCRLATHLVFDLGYRVFEEPTLFFFNPKTADYSQVELLRDYKMRGTIGNHEFRGD